VIQRIIFILTCAVGGIAAAHYGQPYVGGNVDATLIIITVLSIFAGFLVAIITVIGDPALIPVGSWRTVEARRDSIEGQLIRHAWLFVLYLLGIAFLFIGSVIHKAPHVSMDLKIWIERSYLFLGTFSFLLTFGLQWSILKLQLKRLDVETEKRRRAEGIKEKENDDD
jgi:hypothetical protein